MRAKSLSDQVFSTYAAAHAAAEGESLTGMWAFYSPKSSDSFMTWLPDRAWQPCGTPPPAGRRAGSQRIIMVKKVYCRAGRIAKTDFLT
ncbi:protein of unknown function [Agrobacterium pusense]|uniref:Uncharacterized protein n=1 Tax=Agrobacterium pusense TaxID=648995 RepID=U4PW88_9HYPH|nr:protein of unknown function [Agrobacterium pusense]